MNAPATVTTLPTDTAIEAACVDDGAASLIELMEEIRDLPAEERHAALVEWARSPFWSGVLMLCEGWQGKLARAAWRALKRELAADTPGRRWDACQHMVGRASIQRLLGIEGHPAASYAAIPFRTWIDDDARTWIAGAIGAPLAVNPSAACYWQHLDIRDVILWDPRTNEARLAGEHHSANLIVMPDQPEQRLGFWSDCGAYFRAWAARRARVAALASKRARGEWAHPIDEPTDGNLPGALVIGNVLRAPWPQVDAVTIVAQAGLSPTELQAAAYRAARLPVFEGA